MNSEPERPEQEPRERADSVFGLIKRLLPRKQLQPRPYTFVNFPKD
jgi:hypothetical protein